MALLLHSCFIIHSFIASRMMDNRELTLEVIRGNVSYPKQ